LALGVLTNNHPCCISRALLPLAVEWEGFFSGLNVQTRVDKLFNSPGESTALHICAYFGTAEVAKAVVNSISDLNVNLIMFGAAPLMLAARNGHMEVVRLLLIRDDIRADIGGPLKRTPLLYAAMNGHDTVVRMLLERNDVDADSKDIIHYQTPLMYACKNGHSEVVRLLLKNGADVHSCDGYCRTALQLVVSSESYTETAHMLLDSGPDYYGKTALSHTAKAAQISRCVFSSTMAQIVKAVMTSEQQSYTSLLVMVAKKLYNYYWKTDQIFTSRTVSV
jgi:hypothetical protein